VTPSQPIAGHSGVLLSFQAIREAEISRITVPLGQKRKKKFCETSTARGKKLAVVVRTCHSSNFWKYKIRGLKSRPAWAKSETLSQK
jgi:hypothetical protein